MDTSSRATDTLRVTVGDGKYTVVLPKDGRLHALRYGEQWRDCVGDGLVLALALEVEALRELLKECRDEIEGLDHGEGAPGMSIYQRQLVLTLDAALANVKDEPRR